VALPTLQEHVRRHPSDARATALLGVRLGRSGQPDEGLRLLRTGLELDPKLFEARIRLAKVLAASGRAAEAADLLRRGLVLAPTQSAVRRALAELLQAEGRWSEAADEWRHLIRKRQDTDHASIALGECLAELGDAAGARRAADAARRSGNSDGSVAVRLAVLLRRCGAVREAEVELRRALGRNPADRTAAFELGTLLLEGDNVRGAAPLLAQGIEADGGTAIAQRHRLGNLYLDLGRPRDAEETFRQMVRLVDARKPGAGDPDWQHHEHWLARIEAPLFGLSTALRKQDRIDAADRVAARFRVLGSYRAEVRRLRVQMGLRPGDGGLAAKLTSLHRQQGNTALALAASTSSRRSP
jgi:tetratricopeptide (TPR) repeat protein